MNKTCNFKLYRSMMDRIEELKSTDISDELTDLFNSTRLFEKAVATRRDPLYMEESKWSKSFKSESFSSYGEALRLLKESNYKVRIMKNDECAEQFNVDFMYVITPIKNDGFWLDSKFSPDDCYELCNIMGWEVIE